MTADSLNATVEELAYTLAGLSPDEATRVLFRLMRLMLDERHSRECAPRLLSASAGSTSPLCFPDDGLEYVRINGLLTVRPIGPEMTIVARDGRE